MLSWDRNNVKSEDWIFEKVGNFNEFKSFDCDDEDLNEFISEDAEAHKKELIAETYSFRFYENGFQDAPVAFISLSNDSTKLKAEYLENFPDGLRYKDMPAVKIARLGVLKALQGNDIGTELINIIKDLFTTHNRTGCRFITVDAYNKPSVIRFYQKNGFEFYHERDAAKPTRIMFFDLKTYISASKLAA